MEREAYPQTSLIVKPKRRWWQFSVTTLLVIVTTLGVTLGVIGRRAERQRRAVVAIKAIGGEVYYEDDVAEEAETRWIWWVPRDWVQDVKAVRLVGDQYTDAALAHMKELTELESLWIESANITDAGVLHIQGLTNLEELFYEGPQVSDGALKPMQELKGLRGLSLWGNNVTDAGIIHLYGMSELEWLSLGATAITQDGLSNLKTALPNCRISVSRLPSR